MHTILTVTQVFLSIGLIGLVLIQHGRGADAGAAFGSGASATVFGARGSGSFLSRATGIIAALFFLTSMAMAYYAAKGEKPAGLMDGVTGLPVKVETPAAAGAAIVPPVAVPAASQVPAVPSPVPMVPGVAVKAAGSDVPIVPGATVDAAPVKETIPGDGSPKAVPVVPAPVTDEAPVKIETKDEPKEKVQTLDQQAPKAPVPAVVEPAATSAPSPTADK
jgi:preprotein translocase subunit SecG